MDTTNSSASAAERAASLDTPPQVVRVWVVVEVDRGMGPSVSNVYATEEAANEACGGNEFVSGPHDLQNSTPSTLGTPAAAALIYMASDPKLEKVPDFHCGNEEALADMKRLADEEAASQITGGPSE